jgi:hypothetical protein
MGGLNDILCQIELCCAYADSFGRTVIVDTFRQSDLYVRDRFSTYFSSLRDNLVLDAEPFLRRLDSLGVEPAFLAGRVVASRPGFDRERGMFVDAETGEPLSFDFARDHAAPLLVHHQAGGGQHSVRALQRMRLREDLVETLRARLAVTGPKYVGLHIRNTDYRARYRELLEPARFAASDRIFVATDSLRALDDCRAALGPERVFSFAALPAGGERLHDIHDPALAYARNRDSILDLVMLGLADQLHLFEVEPNRWGVRYSGYSILAANLNRNRSVLAGLIGAQTLAGPG